MPHARDRVLVVDDNKVVRQLIKVNPELEGLEVITAADGAECLDVVDHVRPDAVLLDVVMPRLDGLRTATQPRADTRTCDLPLALVGACTRHEIQAGLDIDIDAFLPKPFESAQLVDLVRQLIGPKVGRAYHPEGEPVFGDVLDAEQSERAGRI